MATKRAGSVKAAAKKTARPRGSALPKSMPKKGKNPKGGLTAKGREYFKQKEGSNLKPGVTGAADTPEKMLRKGSFLRRHFTHPRGPMQDDKGQPTRLALSAHAWGEPVPKTKAAAKKLAAKGHELLEKYHATQPKAAARKSPTKSSSTRVVKASRKAPATPQPARKRASSEKDPSAKKSSPAKEKATN